MLGNIARSTYNLRNGLESKEVVDGVDMKIWRYHCIRDYFVLKQFNSTIEELGQQIKALFEADPVDTVCYLLLNCYALLDSPISDTVKILTAPTREQMYENMVMLQKFVSRPSAVQKEFTSKVVEKIFQPNENSLEQIVRWPLRTCSLKLLKFALKDIRPIDPVKMRYLIKQYVGNAFVEDSFYQHFGYNRLPHDAIYYQCANMFIGAMLGPRTTVERVSQMLQKRLNYEAKNVKNLFTNMIELKLCTVTDDGKVELLDICSDYITSTYRSACEDLFNICSFEYLVPQSLKGTRFTVEEAYATVDSSIYFLQYKKYFGQCVEKGLLKCKNGMFQFA